MRKKSVSKAVFGEFFKLTKLTIVLFLTTINLRILMFPRVYLAASMIITILLRKLYTLITYLSVAKLKNLLNEALMMITIKTGI